MANNFKYNKVFYRIITQPFLKTFGMDGYDAATNTLNGKVNASFHRLKDGVKTPEEIDSMPEANDKDIKDKRNAEKNKTITDEDIHLLNNVITPKQLIFSFFGIPNRTKNMSKEVSDENPLAYAFKRMIGWKMDESSTFAKVINYSGIAPLLNFALNLVFIPIITAKNIIKLGSEFLFGMLAAATNDLYARVKNSNTLVNYPIGKNILLGLTGFFLAITSISHFAIRAITSPVKSAKSMFVYGNKVGQRWFDKKIIGKIFGVGLMAISIAASAAAYTFLIPLLVGFVAPFVLPALAGTAIYSAVTAGVSMLSTLSFSAIVASAIPVFGLVFDFAKENLISLFYGEKKDATKKSAVENKEVILDEDQALDSKKASRVGKVIGSARKKHRAKHTAAPKVENASLNDAPINTTPDLTTVNKNASQNASPASTTANLTTSGLEIVVAACPPSEQPPLPPVLGATSTQLINQELSSKPNSSKQVVVDRDESMDIAFGSPIPETQSPASSPEIAPAQEDGLQGLGHFDHVKLAKQNLFTKPTVNMPIHQPLEFGDRKKNQ